MHTKGHSQSTMDGTVFGRTPFLSQKDDASPTHGVVQSEPHRYFRHGVTCKGNVQQTVENWGYNREDTGVEGMQVANKR